MRILIADDERKVGLLIKNLIEWDRLGVEFAGLVSDGAAAYKAIKEERPDIVITDIRMPGISGLELIRRAVEEKIEVRFIVVSGYKYFEYAQQALRYGVEDYLLKPIDETELNQIIGKICSREQGRKQEELRLASAERKLNGSKYVLHKEFLNRVVSGPGASLEDVNRDFGLEFSSGYFQAFCMKIDRDISLEKNSQQIGLILRKLKKIVEQELQGCVADMAVTGQGSGEMMAVINYAVGQEGKIPGALDRIFRKGKEYAGDFEHYGFSMGVGARCQDFSRLNLSVESAREAVACRILEGTGKCLDGGAIDGGSALGAERIAQEVSGRLKNAAEIARPEDIPFLVAGAFAKARGEKLFASEYYSLAKQLAACYFSNEGFQEPEVKRRKQEEWEELADNCGSISGLESLISGLISGDLKESVEKAREKERKPVLDALEYIRAHYMEKLSLEEIAAGIGFNMNYFCELFKKETGKTFTAYVTEVRMEEAKKLLRDTSQAVYAVAEQVGYKDAKFFSQQFVKTVGIKPSEYRKLYY